MKMSLTQLTKSYNLWSNGERIRSIGNNKKFIYFFSYLVSSTTSTSVGAVMGALECPAVGSSVFSSPFVELITCRISRNKKWYQTSQTQKTGRKGSSLNHVMQLETWTRSDKDRLIWTEALKRHHKLKIKAGSYSSCSSSPKRNSTVKSS